MALKISDETGQQFDDVVELLSKRTDEELQDALRKQLQDN